MAFSITRFIKGLRLSVSGTTNPANLDLTPAGTDGTTTTVQSSQTANRTLTLPDATDTLVGKVTTDTLSNKTLDNSNVITVQDTNLTIQDNADNTKQVKLNASGITTGTTRTLDVPDEDTTIVGTGATQNISNKTLNNTNSITVKDVNLTIQDDSDTTKAVKFQASGITTGTTRTLQIPDADTTIVGTNASQNLSNKTIDNSNTVTLQDSNLTIQDNGDATKQLKFEASGITTGTTRTLTAPDANTTIVGTDAAQTLTNKTISGASNTISNISLTSSVTGTLPIGNGGTGQTTASAAFDALSPLAGKGSLLTRTVSGHTSLSVGTDGNVLVADSSQASGLKWSQISGVKNYISNGATESATTTGWATYNDGSSATPVDGTGGSPTITFSASPSTPLRGVNSFILTKGGSTSRRGEGVSYDFTVDEADKAKPLSISFDYKVFSGTYADGDMTVYIYDVTNSQVIQPSGYSILNMSGSAVQKAEFQTNSNSTSYRLIFHIASTSAVDYQMQFDNIVVGPIVTTIGPAVSDWQSYSLTIGAVTTPPTPGTVQNNTARWRRVGDSMEIEYNYNQTGAGSAGSGNYLFPLPSGYSMDANKVYANSNTAYGTQFGLFSGYSSSVASSAPLIGYVTYYNATNLVISAGNEGNAFTSIGSAYAPLSGATVSYRFRATVPISGWSSNSVVSSDTDTRVVAARANTSTSSTTSGAGAADIIYTSKSYDTHGVYNTSTGVYTVAVPGKYEIKAAIGTNAATAGSAERQLQIYIIKNGSIVSYKQSYSNSTASRQVFTDIVDTIDLVAGDTIKLQWTHNWGVTLTCSGSSSENFFSIDRISGPSQIAASESVVAIYTGSSTSVPNSTETRIVPNTKVKDTHGAMSSGVFTLPAPGTYRVTANVSGAGSQIPASAAKRYTQLSIRQGGVNKIYGPIGGLTFQATTATTFEASVSGTITGIAGETVDVTIWQNYGASGSLQNSGETNICIERVGN